MRLTSWVNLRTRLITRLICINLRSAGGGIRLRSYKVFTSFLGATFRKSWATISFFFCGHSGANRQSNEGKSERGDTLISVWIVWSPIKFRRSSYCLIYDEYRLTDYVSIRPNKRRRCNTQLKLELGHVEKFALVMHCGGDKLDDNKTCRNIKFHWRWLVKTTIR